MGTVFPAAGTPEVSDEDEDDAIAYCPPAKQIACESS